MSLRWLILRRLALAVPMVIGTSLIAFSIIYFVPGDPVIAMAGDRSHDTQLVEKLREELKLNDPFWVRYGRFLAGIVVLDFGRSYRTNRLISSDLAEAFPASVELAVFGVLFSISLGVMSGIISALRRNTVWDFSLMAVALAGVSIPAFWLGLILNYFFAFKWPWFEISGRLSGDFAAYTPITHLAVLDAILMRDVALLGDALRHLVLPAVTLGLIGSAIIARMTRSSVLEVSSQDFVRTARAKGLGRLGVLRHLLRNAVLPVVTIVGLQLGGLLGGAIMTEEIFAWPGMGTYLVQAIRYRDFVAVQGTVMAFVLVFLLVNLLVDLLYHALDPRLRTGRGA